ncbi:septal ring lytic transglycosylase RlpA family protein [Catalinimonas niigatensis]|uniref:septal ring lytic transglycosylase RlpA family protein n=1 Tax=Catalinimonas niigatensis TaxID=1397264 RepID=UPI00266701E6|nr:septal ring lytic transglycosylase RlpA family protein [Catalinimonas niigatensis]WPP52946.1 septal ring lytic transglycosylase RlpA family protein [Catalinimonas niigatensis]
MLKLIHVSFLLGYAIIQACQPFVEKYNFSQEGKASYYANVLNGKPTASGEAYHPDSLTAAHRYLPLGTVILVVNPRNQRQIRLRVNDRGPYHRSRVLDVSRSAADSLGFLDDGVAHVHIKALLSPQLADSLSQQLNKVR